MQSTETHIEDLSNCIETCNKMLRGERSAIETYDIAIEKFSTDPQAGKLTAIRAEHAESVEELERSIIEMGGTPDLDSGAWGEFATLVQSSANLLGDKSAIASLKQGEAKGKSDYEAALENGDVLTSCRELYTNTLLPRIRRHISALEAMSEAVS